MKPRHKRLAFISCAVLGLTVAVLLVMNALRQNLVFYYTPTEILSLAHDNPQRVFRLGGMVKKGSVRRDPHSARVSFVVTDFKQEITVEYTGLLPDLFREGQGVIAQGHFTAAKSFMAMEVLAKHDEKYMPPKISGAPEKP